MAYEMSFCIRVVDSGGNPYSGVSVAAHTPLDSQRGHTDGDGWVEMEFHLLTASFRIFQIYVDGEDKGKYAIEDGGTLSFTV